jgi:hypothetical protein
MGAASKDNRALWSGWAVQENRLPTRVLGIQLLQRYKREAAYRNPLVPHQTPHTLYTLHNKVCLSPFSCIPVLIFSLLVMFAMAMGDTRFASVAVRA